MKILLVLLVFPILVLSGCALSRDVQTALAHPVALETAKMTGGPLIIDGRQIPDEAVAVAIGIKEGIETAARDPTPTGLLAGAAALLLGGGGWYLKRKFLTKAVAQ